jgi:hypothetical protein
MPTAVEEKTARIAPLTKRKAWKALEAHYKKVRPLHLRDCLRMTQNAGNA